LRTEVRDVEIPWRDDTPYESEVVFVHYEADNGKTRFANVERITRDGLRELRKQIDEYLGET
jgi:hypothetical protein